MRERFSRLDLRLLSVLVCLSVLTNVAGCAHAPVTDFGGGCPSPDPRFEVPEAYELASVIASLTPYGRSLTYSADTTKAEDRDRAAYARAVADHFGPYADHPAVAAVGARGPGDIDRMYNLRGNAYAYRFDGDALVHDAPFSHVWGGPRNRFSQNAALIEDFARETNFRAFYAAHRPYYDATTARDSSTADLAAMRAWLGRRLPRRGDTAPPALRVAYSPLTDGWHATKRFEDGGCALLVMFVEPGPAGPGRAHDFARMLFTEVDHNYVNPVSERFRSELGGRETYGAARWVDRDVLRGNYRSGYEVFNEYMTFAVFELWARDHYPPAVAAAAAENTRRMMTDRRGFVEYRAFSDEVRRLYDTGVAESEAYEIESMYPDLIAWARASVG